MESKFTRKGSFIMNQNNQTKTTNKTTNYSKKIISCVFVVACISTSASAMLSTFLNEGSHIAQKALRTAQPFTAKGSFIAYEQPSFVYASKRTYHVEVPLTKIEQQNIVVKELLKEKSLDQLNTLLKNIEKQGVTSETLDVVRSLYTEPKTPLLTNSNKAYPSSYDVTNTAGC